jgi:pimeloyl-ACP methyl ester carboxylesterase
MALRSYLDGAVFAERTDGPGPALIGLPGWGRTRRDLAGVLSGRAALLVDLPGFGSSPPPPSAWGAADYASAVAKVAEADGRGPYVLVGHSFGGRVAVCLGAQRPDLVAGIVAIGSPLLRLRAVRRPSLRYRTARLARRVGVISEERMERHRRRAGSADYVAARGVMRQVLVRSVAESYEAELAALACPVALCWGANDTEAPAPIAARAAALIADVVSCEVVEDAGHDLHRSHPDIVVAAIDALEAGLRCR